MVNRRTPAVLSELFDNVITDSIGLSSPRHSLG